MPARLYNFGGHTGRETPLPIPNREVKPARADGTRRATSRGSRAPPINFAKPPPCGAGFAGFGARGLAAFAGVVVAAGRNPAVAGRQAARSFSLHVGSSALKRLTLSLTGGCVTNSAAKPSSWNGLIV